MRNLSHLSGSHVRISKQSKKEAYLNNEAIRVKTRIRK